MAPRRPFRIRVIGTPRPDIDIDQLVQVVLLVSQHIATTENQRRERDTDTPDTDTKHAE